MVSGANIIISPKVWFVWFVGFLTSSSITRLYRGRVPRQFHVLPHTRQSGETMTSVSAGHIILTSTQPVGSGRPQRESHSGPPHQESSALPTGLLSPQERPSTNSGCLELSDSRSLDSTDNSVLTVDLFASNIWRWRVRNKQFTELILAGV